jgi:hypothetical protein
MTFLEALTAAKDKIEWIEVRVFRVDGPSFVLDELSQMRLEIDCLYLGDIFDMDDWQIEKVI